MMQMSIKPMSMEEAEYPSMEHQHTFPATDEIIEAVQRDGQVEITLSGRVVRKTEDPKHGNSFDVVLQAYTIDLPNEYEAMAIDD